MSNLKAFVMNILMQPPHPFVPFVGMANQLPSFLKEHYNQYPYLAELALFEWTLALVFDASDSALLQLADMQTIPPEAWIDLKLVIHPSLHRWIFHGI